MRNKIDYISDLFLDRDITKRAEIFKNSLPEKPNEILIISGNLAKDTNVILNTLIKYKKNYKYIFYVPGSEEMKLTEDENRIFVNNSFKKLNMIKDVINTEEFEGIYYLDGFDNQKIYLEEYNLSFAGLSMFWDHSGFSKNLSTIEIDNDYKKLFPEIHSEVSFGNNEVRIRKLNSSKFFRNFKKRLDALEHCDVLITCYSPLNTKNPYFGFDGSKNIDKIKPKFWFYGNDCTNRNISLKDTIFINTFNKNGKINQL